MLRRSLSILAMIVVFGAFFFSSPPPTPKRTPTFGLIEHRGTFYRFEDLLNPAYRAASDDPFVQSFNQGSHFANGWAGLGDNRQNLAVGSLDRSAQSIEINIHDLTPEQRHALEARVNRTWAGANPPFGD